jgi:capsular polysaccharide transport system permease protein
VNSNTGRAVTKSRPGATPVRADKKQRLLDTEAPGNWVAVAGNFSGAALKRKRRVAFLVRLMIFVGLPTLLSAAYVFLYATPRYVSEFQITYQGDGSSALTNAPPSTLANLLTAGASSTDMNSVLTAYFTSSDMLSKIDAQLDLRTRFGGPRIDYWDRLPPDPSAEKFLSYFNSMIAVNLETGGYVVVDVQAFDPQSAREIAVAMAKAADDMVAGMTERARHDEVSFAQAQMSAMQDRLRGATLDVTNFRNEHQNFDPNATAAQLDAVIGNLESQLSQARSSLATAKALVNDDSPTITSLNAQIEGFEQQIVAEQKRLASPNGSSEQDSTLYSQLVAQYTDLLQEQTFATDAYVAGKQAYYLAQADAARKQAYAVSFVPPNLPQYATVPDPVRYISTTFLVSLMVYVIGSLLVGAFRDQAGL